MGHLTLCTLLGALLVYLLLPRPARRSDTIRCRPAAAVLPDLVGAIMLGGLFGISLLLASQMASTGSPMTSDWLVPSLIIWLLAALGLAVFSLVSRLTLSDPRIPRSLGHGSESHEHRGSSIELKK